MTDEAGADLQTMKEVLVANKNSLGNSSRKFKKFKKKRTKTNNVSKTNSKAVIEANALYQMVSDAAKKDLETKLAEYKAINEQLAKENQELKQRLRKYEESEMIEHSEDEVDSL